MNPVGSVKDKLSYLAVKLPDYPSSQRKIFGVRQRSKPVPSTL